LWQQPSILAPAKLLPCSKTFTTTATKFHEGGKP
jgi:hypothetical protein